jgi:hypothetical protein
MDKIMESYSDPGMIYILTHPSYDNNIKISRTNNIHKRLKTHCCSHIINPQMIFTVKTINYKLAERLVHQRLRQYKVKCQSSREFFSVDLCQAVEIINDVIEMVNNPMIINTAE